MKQSRSGMLVYPRTGTVRETAGEDTGATTGVSTRIRNGVHSRLYYSAFAHFGLFGFRASDFHLGHALIGRS